MEDKLNIESMMEKNSTEYLQQQNTEAESQECNEQRNMLDLLSKKFQTHDELIVHVRNFFFEKGYVLSIQSSRKDKYVTIGCDLGGIYRNRHCVPFDKRQRKTSSRLRNCSFMIKGKKQDEGFWTLEEKNNLHNHEASVDMSGHSSCRRLSKEEISSVETMSKSGIAPRHILTSLRQKNNSLQAVSRSVYNAKAKIYRENLGCRTIIQALFEEFGDGDFTFNVQHNETGHLTHLFFAHPLSITLTRNYQNVFVMDCTYKTNKYKMPVLDIIGISSLNSSFYSCFALLEKECEQDYVWALDMFKIILGDNVQPSVIVSDRELALMNTIRVVFPKTINLLCVWHIKKNILANCKRYFEVQDEWNSFLSSWNGIIYASNEVEYAENWKQFEGKYAQKQNVINYTHGTWLPYHEYFISAWTEKHLHFGNRVSSRAESAHAKLKRYLQVYTGDFCQLKDKICLAIENEFQEIKAHLATERLHLPHCCNSLFFKNLTTRVSKFAMRQLHNQYEMVKYGKVTPLCKGHFTATMGLPCAHKMMSWKGGMIPLDFIHSQWRIDSNFISSLGETRNRDDGIQEMFTELQYKYQQCPLVQKEYVRETLSQCIDISTSSYLEPTIQPHKGRPIKNARKNNSSTTEHIPSNFEMVENRRRCRVCKGVGHNSRTCKETIVVDELDSRNMDFSMNEGGQSNLVDLNLDYNPINF
ncbi:PKS-NRPS hybrid synthetase cheA-like [Mercurialis annua]|uniref:PKS-NRPS hybrid synthetase cheA-like n=1 Tax=Mercurialis annua TaxID=3986 RepID=UPI00215E9022|nr:PKS-NRPS hybrid synthetase cheA-like [Mercurialis annua]